MHEAVGMQPNAKHVHTEPGKTRHDVAKNGITINPR